MLEDVAIAAILSRASDDPNRACHNLIEEALKRGGEDNVTVIVVGQELSAVTAV
jgi:protein phosphatase